MSFPSWLRSLFIYRLDVQYLDLLEYLRANNTPVLRANDVCRLKAKRFCMVIHRVDKLSSKYLRLATKEHCRGFKTTYFIRSCNHKIDKTQLLKYKQFEHEIGYYYENMSYVNKAYKCTSYHEMINKAHLNFENNITKLREAIPVFFILARNTTLQIDNHDLWNHFTMREVGVRADIELDARFYDVVLIKRVYRHFEQFYVDSTGTRVDNGNRIRSIGELIKTFTDHDIPDRIILDY